MADILFKPKSVIFKITEFFQDPQMLYDRTRAAWKMSPKRANLDNLQYAYAYAAKERKIVSCYHIKKWIGPNEDGRFLFEGDLEFNDPMVGQPCEKIAHARGGVVFYGDNINNAAEETPTAEDAALVAAAAKKAAEEAAAKKAKSAGAVKCEDNGDGRLVLQQGENRLFFRIVEDHADVVSEYDGMWDMEPKGEISIPEAVTDGKNKYDVTTIARLVFANCTQITAINLSNSVTLVDEKAFYACSKLQSIDFKNVSSIGKNAFNGCTGLQSIDFKNVSSIGEAAFQKCSSLTKVIIPTGIKVIPDSAFYGCSKLEKVIIPASVEKIDRYAFGACYALGNVVIPNKKATIGDNAFCHIKGQVIR